MRAFLFVLVLLICGSAAAQAPVFRLNYLPGVRYVLTEYDTTETRMTLGLPAEMGGAQEMQQRQAGMSVSDVHVEAESDSILLVTTTLRRIRSRREHNGQVQFVDTDSAAVTGPAEDVFAALIGHAVRARVGRDGRVREVLGLDSLVQRFADAAGLPAELRDLAETSIRGMVDGFAAGPNAVYPDAEVQPGSTWTATLGGLQPTPIQTRLTYTLDGIHEGDAHVRFEGTVSTPADAPPMGAGPFAMNMQLAGTMQGTWASDLVDGTYTLTTRSTSSGTGAQVEAMPGMPTLTMRMVSAGTRRAELRRAAP
jgi:hypothetical protein